MEGSLSLTPAYDICPQARAGGEAGQAMLIHGARRDSQLGLCIDAAGAFLLTREAADAIIDQQVAIIGERYDTVCDEAGLSVVGRDLMRGRQFLNPYVLQDYRKA